MNYAEIVTEILQKLKHKLLKPYQIEELYIVFLDTNRLSFAQII